MPDIVQIGNREIFREHGRLRYFVAYVADTILYFMNGYIRVIQQVRIRVYAIYARGRLFGKRIKEGQTWVKKAG